MPRKSLPGDVARSLGQSLMRTAIKSGDRPGDRLWWRPEQPREDRTWHPPAISRTAQTGWADDALPRWPSHSP